MKILLSNVIKDQAILNIGCTGHVSNGKSTLVKLFTGIETQKFKSEKERNITINLGYASCKIYYSCANNEYKYAPSNITKVLDSEGNEMKLIHHFSFVDCPGHESFMNNMITGSSVMDMAFLIEDSSAENIPQPQTYEHLVALLNTSINNILVLQNKCDLVTKKNMYIVKDKIDKFLNKIYGNHSLTIIPCIAQKGINTDYIIHYLINNLRSYNKELNKPLLSSIIRTFDINKQNTEINSLKGGILGCSIIDGVIKLNDFIQISPGIVKKVNSVWYVKPIYTQITSILCDKKNLNLAIPGGLIGLGTMLDPYLCKNNRLVGQVITYPGENPPIIISVTIIYNRFKRDIKYKLKHGNSIILGILGCLVNGVIHYDEDRINIKLEKPICLSNKKLTIISKINQITKIVGLAEVIDYEEVKEIEIEKKFINTNISDKYELINDLHCKNIDIPKYEEMINNLEGCKVKNKKLKISKPILSKQKNNLQISITNYKEIINECIHVKNECNFEKIFIDVLEKEINYKIYFNESNHLIINNRIKPDLLTKSFLNVLVKLKKCIVCNSTDTYLSKQSRLLKINCLTCNSINSYI